MNRLKILLLLILQHNEAKNEFQSMTVKEIVETDDFPDWKDNTVRKSLNELEQAEFVRQGVKDGRCVTYFITEAGLNMIGELV